MKKGKKLVNVTGCVRSCSVAETVINIEDLLIEILLRLPAKSLVKCKAVSKKWLGLISDSNFASLHTRRNPHYVGSALILSNLKFFPISDPKTSGHPKQLSCLMAMDFRIPWVPVIEDSRNGLVLTQRTTLFGDYAVCNHTLRDLEIEDSCNGLLLCQRTAEFSDGLYKGYVVCNPTTQKFRQLPTRKRILKWTHVCLVFDPLKSPHFLIVEVCFDGHFPSRSCEIEIYQSEIDNWTQGLKFDIPKEWGHIYRDRSFCNGAIHWISGCGYHILFDPYSMELSGIKLPVCPKILSPCIKYFGECDGRLFLIQTRKNNSPGFCVLEMGGDNCSWIATYRVNLRGLMEDVPRRGENLEIFGFSVKSIVKGGKKEDLSLVLNIPGKTVSYGLETKEWFVLDDLSDYIRCYPFIESLAPVPGCP